MLNSFRYTNESWLFQVPCGLPGFWFFDPDPGAGGEDHSGVHRPQNKM